MEETIGNRIRALREAKGLSQEKLGNMVGVSKAAISQWELGKNKKFEEQNFELLVSALETTKFYLKTGKHIYVELKPSDYAPDVKERLALNTGLAQNDNEIKALTLIRLMLESQRKEWLEQGRQLAELAKQIREEVKKEEGL